MSISFALEIVVWSFVYKLTCSHSITRLSHSLLINQDVNGVSDILEDEDLCSILSCYHFSPNLGWSSPPTTTKSSMCYPKGPKGVVKYHGEWEKQLYRSCKSRVLLNSHFIWIVKGHRAPKSAIAAARNSDVLTSPVQVKCLDTKPSKIGTGHSLYNDFTYIHNMVLLKSKSTGPTVLSNTYQGLNSSQHRSISAMAQILPSSLWEGAE